MCLLKLECRTLMPNGVVFRAGAFGRGVGREGAPMNGLSGLIKEPPESSLVPSAM